jgi:hypothetical protein
MTSAVRTSNPTNLSVNRMVEKGLIVTFSYQGCRVYDEEDCTIQGEVQVTGSNFNGI